MNSEVKEALTNLALYFKMQLEDFSVVIEKRISMSGKIVYHSYPECWKSGTYSDTLGSELEATEEESLRNMCKNIGNYIENNR